MSVMPNRKGFDDVVDFLRFPLELPFQLLGEKAPGSLQNSELRNLIPPRPPLPHEIIDQAIKPGSNPGNLGRKVSYGKLDAAADITIALTTLCEAIAGMGPARASGMLGYLSGELVKTLGAEKAREVVDLIEKIVQEETRS